ncbi:exodeoxyribonuclease III [Candidatus Parcubacteria bacterium]|nr:exodeoxyribonuclease III [Candidatus Parcubacteria bacterium]
MTIVSWNINGIRAVIKKGFLGFLEKQQPDILCLQEIKIDSEAIKLAEFDFSGYTEFYNPAERKGYSGTAILLKNNLAKRELSSEASELSSLISPKLKWDDEGRVQVLDIGKFYLANIYFPNSNHELSRLDFKINFNNKLLAYFKKLTSPPTPSPRTGEGAKGKPLIVCGDFNVAHNEIDLARPKENIGNPGFHPRERAWMDKFLKVGFVDTFRDKYPDKIEYSWWSYRAGARVRNVGWRIDYFCVSQGYMKKIKDAFIWNKIMGSDHCPVGIKINN